MLETTNSKFLHKIGPLIISQGLQKFKIMEGFSYCSIVFF